MYVVLDMETLDKLVKCLDELDEMHLAGTGNICKGLQDVVDNAQPMDLGRVEDSLMEAISLLNPPKYERPEGTWGKWSPQEGKPHTSG